MVAQQILVSTKPFPAHERSVRKPDEAALARLDERAVEPSARGRSSSVDDGSPSTFTPPCAISRRASLVDEPERARRARPAGAPGRRPAARRSGTSSGRPPLADDAREVRLGRARGLLPVRARDDPARERELRLERVAARDRLAVDARGGTTARAASSEMRIVRAELLLGRRRRAGCCCRPTSSSSRRPTTTRSGVVSTTCGSSP